MQLSFLLTFKSGFCYVPHCTNALPTFDVMFPDPDFLLPGFDISLGEKSKMLMKGGNINSGDVVMKKMLRYAQVAGYWLSPSHFCFDNLTPVRSLLEPTIRQAMLTSSSSSVQSERKGTNSSRDLSSPRATAMVDSLLTLFSLRPMSSFFNSSLQAIETAWGRSLQALLNSRLQNLPSIVVLHEDCYWIEPTFVGMCHVLA